METGVVTIQEPVSTKTKVGEAPAGVILDHSSMEIQKVNLSTVLDDEITSGSNSTIPGETDVADIVNGSGNNISVVEDRKIVSETEKDEQGSIFVHKPESLNKDIEDANIILNDVTLEKEKETGKPEEVSIEKPVTEEDHTKTKHSPEQEDQIGNISKAREEIPIKTDEVKVEKNSRTVETSVNGTEAEHNTTVLVEEEISRNGENIVNELEKEEETNIDEEPEIVKTVIEDPEIVYKEETTVLEPVSFKETAEPVEAEQISREVTVNQGKEEDITQNTEEVQEIPRVIETPTIKGEEIESKASLHEIETTKRVLPEAEKQEDKEEMKTVEEPRLNVIEIVNIEETTVHESESLKENAEPVEAIRSSDNEVTVNRAKEEEITENTEEIQDNPSLIETSKIQGEDNESEVSLDTKEEVDHSSNETEEHEHVLGRDLPQCETSEVEAVETKEETKPSVDLKEDKVKEETETVKTVISSNEVSSSTVQEEECGEHTDPYISEIEDESHGREESVEVKSKETVLPDVSSTESEKHKDLPDVSSTESETYQENEPETTIVANTESHEKFERSPSDISLNVDKEEQNDEKTKVDQIDGTQIMEEQRGLDSNGVEAEQIDRNRTDETEESPVAKQVPLQDVEPVEQTQKPSLDSPSQVSEETSKTVDATIDEKSEEEKVTMHQEDQEEGSYGLETKKETVSVPESIETGEKSQEERSVIDLSPLQEESKLETHELTNEEVKSDEVREVSSTSLPKELEIETVVEAEKIETKKKNEDETAAVDNIQKSLETVETVQSHNSLPSYSEEQEHGTVSEKTQDEKVEEVPMVSKDIEEQTTDMEPSLTEKSSMDQNQPEEQVEEACSRDEQEKEISSNSENTANETATTGESLHDVETTKRVLFEVEKEDEEAEIDTYAEPRLDVIEKKEIETAKVVVEDIEIVNNEEATTHESETLKGDNNQGENAEYVEVIKNSDDVEKISSEVTEDREKDEDITQKAEEVQESPSVIETESKASLEIKDEVYQSSKDNEIQGREESVEIKSKDIVQDESIEEKYVNLPDVQSGESEKYQENEPVTSAVEGAGLNESIHNQTLVDVESVEKVQKASLETPSELSEQTRKTVDETIEEKPKEEVTMHQEGQEEGSNGLETKEETVSVPESRELGEKTQEEESCLQNEQEKEVKLQKEQMDKHEPTEEEVFNYQQSPVEEKSDDVIQVSSALPSEAPEDEIVVKAEKVGEEQVADKMIVETSSFLLSSEEQEHVTVTEKTDGEEVKEAEPVGDMREKGLEIAETTHLSLPSVDQKEDVKAFDEEIQIPTATLPLEDQEKVSSTEKGETKTNETDDEKPDEHVDSSTSPLFSEKNDDEHQIAEAEKRDEEITLGTSKTSENACIQQDEFEKPEATKLEELKEDKSQEIAETIKEIEDTSDQTLPIQTSQADSTASSELVSEQEDKTPKQVEEVYEEEHKVEATGYRNLSVETLQAYQTQSADLISALNDQSPKHVEETHEEETKEEHKLQAEEILATEAIPRELSDDALASMLASKEDGQVALQEYNCADGVRETKDTQEERPGSVKVKESVGETKPKEPEDEMRDEDVKTPTSPIISETLIAEAKKGSDEAISETEKTMALDTLGTSRASENVCIKQEELGNHKAPKLEEPKEENRQDIPNTAEAIAASQEDQTLSSELVSGLDDQTPRQVEQIQEEEANKGRKFEGTGDQSLPVETSQEYQTPYSDLASGLDDQTPQQVEETKEEQKLQVAVDKVLPVETSQEDQTLSLVSEHEDQTSQQVDEIHEEETKVTHKVQAEEILSTKTVPRELFSETPVSMLPSGEDAPVTPQEGNTADDTQVEQHVSAEIEESVGETKPKEPEDEMRDEHVETPTSSIILEKNDNETLIVEAKKGDEDIDETETAVDLESSGTSTKSENLSHKQEDLGNPEAPKLEESKEEKIQEIPETDKAIDATSDQIFLVEKSQAEQIASLASEQDDQIPKQVEEILEEETKESQKVQADDILSIKTVPRESFSEAPVSMLASGEDEPVTSESKESEAEGTETSDDLVETSTKITEVEDASTKKTDVEVAELTNDYPTDEAGNRDETYSTLPVVGILTELQNTLETEGTVNDSASKGDNMIKEPADQDQKTGDTGVESNEKDSATGIIESYKFQQDESRETEKINLQEEHKEDVTVQDGISREFEVNDEEKLQEGTREIAEYKEEVPADQSVTEVLPGEKILIPSSVLPSEEIEDVISPAKQEECEPQQDINASKSENISLQEEQKDETHETVKDEKKDDEEQEIVSSELNKDEEDASELGVGNDFVSRVEKEEVPQGVLENEEEINEAVKPEKQITDPVGVRTKASEAEHESNQEPVETQAISDDTKRNDSRDLSTEEAPKVEKEEASADKYLTREVLSEQLQVPSSTALDDLKENSNPEADWDLSIQKPSELIHQSHDLPQEENVEEASFEVKNAQDDKNEENGNALITNENLQVQDQPKDVEAPEIEKEMSEQELTSNDPTHVREDIGTNVKPAVDDEETRADSHDSIVVLKEEAGLIEEKMEVEHVKKELEDAIKHEVSVEEKNKLSENIDRQAAQEIYQEESKQTYTIKENIRKEEKETNQESLENVKKTDDSIEKTQPEIQDIVSKVQDKPEQKDEVPNQQEREIADEVPKLENLKTGEELQKKDGESKNTTDLFSEVKETEPTLKEPARKSLSDLIQKVKGTNKTEDVTTEPNIEEEPKTVEEDENDNGDHEHDKTSPDSIVMVEAKDTVSIIKTHKKSQGILSGVGSKVKHSISKVKKVLTGKSSHTTKPSSPK